MLLLGVLGSACTSSETKNETGTVSTRPASAYSGFLGDYPEFEPGLYGGDALVYVAPGADLKRYQQLLIDPVTIWTDPQASDKDIEPAQLQALADAVRQSFVDRLSGRLSSRHQTR